PNGEICGGGGPNLCGTGSCVPDCAGKPCGASDGCNGLCDGSCATGLRCLNFMCVCDSVSCRSGCCFGNQCMPGTTQSACGTSGGQCRPCNANEVCEANTCTPCGSAGQSCCNGICNVGTSCVGGACAVTNVWAAGDGGNIVHWNGTNWALVRSGGGDLTGIAGPSGSNMWSSPRNAAGAFLYFDGVQWTSRNISITDIITAMWGFGNSIFAVSQQDALGGSVYVFSPALGWNQETSQTGNGFYGVGGTSFNDVWVVGEGGTIKHRTVSGWANSPSGTTAVLSGVWASGVDNAWIVGDGGLSLHWNGTSWTPIGTGTPRPLRAIWGNGSS